MLAGASVALLVACGGAPPAADVPEPPTGPMLDASCRESAEADMVAFDCGRFVAVDAVAHRATSSDVERALSDFASQFGGGGAKRFVTDYVQGDVREWGVRVERSAASGATLEARMLAIIESDRTRLLSCSPKAPGVSCATVLTELAARQRSRVTRGS